jgi:phosphatase NudJ
VPVKITGLLRIEHTPRHDGSRVRVVYLAEPVDDAEPKSVPDEESLAAKWVRVDELDRYPLRGDEVRQMIEYVQAGGPAYPIDLILPEGVPFSVFK